MTEAQRRLADTIEILTAQASAMLPGADDTSRAVLSSMIEAAYVAIDHMVGPVGPTMVSPENL